MLNYQIIAFDPVLGSIQVLYKNGEEYLATYNVDIPLTDDGLYITGEKLNSYLMSLFPTSVMLRIEQLDAGIPNSDEIEALVDPLPPILDLTPPVDEIQPKTTGTQPA